MGFAIDGASAVVEATASGPKNPQTTNQPPSKEEQDSQNG